MKRRPILFLLVFALAALIGLGAAGSRASAQTPPNGVSIQPASSSINPGATQVVAVQTQSPSCGGVSGNSSGCLAVWTFNVAYDSTVLKPTACAGHNGTSCNFTANPIIVTGIDFSGNGFPGSTDMADITFTSVTPPKFGAGAITPTVATFNDFQGNAICQDGTTVTYPGQCAAGNAPAAAGGTITINTPPADATKSTLTPSSQNVEAVIGQSGAITATVEDSNGDLLPNQAVTLTPAAGTSSTITCATSPNPCKTDTNGQVVFTVSDSTVENVTYTGSVGTTTFTTPTATVDFTAGPPNAGNSSVLPATQNVAAVAGSSGTITVTLKDSGSHALQGRTVTLAAGSGSSTISPTGGVAQTNSSGVATFTVSDTALENVTYTATDTTTANSPITIGTAQVNFTAGPVVAANSSISATPTTGITANGAASTTVTVTLADSGNHPAAGRTVTLSTGSATTAVTCTSVVSGQNCQTNSSGVVTFTVTDTKAETITLSATDTTDTVTVSKDTNGQPVTVAFVAGPAVAANSTVAASPSSVAVGSNGSVVVTLRDANNNLVSGDTVTLAATAGGSHSTITGSPSAPTGTNGVATFTVKDGTIENVTYTATDTGPSITGTIGTAQVRFVASNPETISGRVSQFFYTKTNIEALVNGAHCGATTSVTYTNVYSLTLPGACAQGPITIIVGNSATANAGLSYQPPTGRAQTCLDFQSGANLTNVSIVVGGTPDSSCGAQIAPGAPQNVTAVAGNASATVNWQAAFNGNSAITQYTVTTQSSSAGANNPAPQNVSGTTFSTTISDLTNGDSYTFTVTATNAIGTGTGATSNAVTPTAAPPSPETLSGRTTDFTYTARTINVDTSSILCGSSTQTYTNVFSVKLPGNCDGGAGAALTFFVVTTDSHSNMTTTQYVLQNASGQPYCATFQPGATVSNLSLAPLGSRTAPACSPRLNSSTADSGHGQASGAADAPR